MLTCPQCHAGLPEGMRFCLQCGAPLAPGPPALGPSVDKATGSPATPVAPPPPKAAPFPPVPHAGRMPPRRPLPTVNLKIAPTPVLTPPAGPYGAHGRPSLGDQAPEIDEESLKKSFERPTQPGIVACRFCKGPMDVTGEFCEQCGAPVEEAAPGRALGPKLEPSSPGSLPPPVDAGLGPSLAQNRGDIAPLDAAESSGLPEAGPPSGPSLEFPQSAGAEPPPLISEPEFVVATPPPQPEERPQGFMGRIKGLFRRS